MFRVEKSPVEQSAKQIEYRNSGVDWKNKLNEKLKADKTESAQTRSLTQTEQIVQKEAIKLIEQAKQSEPEIMNHLKDISQQTNGEMVGLEYRFKSEESLTRKIIDRSGRIEKALIKQGKNPKEAADIALNQVTSGINDSLRYTMMFPKENYYNACEVTVKTMKKQGYQIEEAKNFWEKAGTKEDFGYRGINATIIAPNGQKFELQFHTPESFELKIKTHHLYEESRESSTSPLRRKELRQIQIQIANNISAPSRN